MLGMASKIFYVVFVPSELIFMVGLDLPKPFSKANENFTKPSLRKFQEIPKPIPCISPNKSLAHISKTNSPIEAIFPFVVCLAELPKHWRYKTHYELPDDVVLPDKSSSPLIMNSQWITTLWKLRFPCIWTSMGNPWLPMRCL